MTDLFIEKAQDWDTNERVQRLSSAIGKKLLSEVFLSKDMEVMDFGAGTGLISEYIAPYVKKVVAVDTSEAMLEKLTDKPLLSKKVQALCRNILKQPLNAYFDLIVSAMALHHIENTSLLLKTFSEHLYPGGLVVLADLDTEDGSFHPENTEGVYHYGFDREELKSLLLAHDFEEIHFTTAHTIQKEGKHYPVFMVTARKM
jgi:2-polyprenyl-3-methyl-5-hydroxy-6-metoxy-1,4-benzoquinol methylase